MKDTAPERLAKAIASLQNRIHSFCKKHNESEFRMGMCLAHPKRAFLKPPTKEIQEKLDQIGKVNKLAGFHYLKSFDFGAAINLIFKNLR
jgi:hypothetical protein